MALQSHGVSSTLRDGVLRAGQYSTLYIAPDSGPSQILLKVILLPRSHGGSDQARILSQRHNALASQLQQIAHPHVYSIPLMFFDSPTDSPALFMPLFRNGNITDYLSLFPADSSNTARARRLLIAETADALSFLHRHGIVHGNVRGSNILVTEAGHALLVDTGINATVVDTCEYIPLPENASWLAPELFVWEEEGGSSNACTAMSDIYSFGRTIEEVYLLRPPFSHIAARNQMQFIVRLRSLILAPPVRPFGMPPAMWVLMRACLATAPNNRPSSRAVHRQLLQMH